MKGHCLKTAIIKLFETYLSNRRLSISLDYVFSEAAILNCSVSQGSILEPIYINEPPQSLSENSCILYANDMCIFYQSKESKYQDKQNGRCSK